MRVHIPQSFSAARFRTTASAASGPGAASSTHRWTQPSGKLPTCSLVHRLGTVWSAWSRSTSCQELPELRTPIYKGYSVFRWFEILRLFFQDVINNTHINEYCILCTNKRYNMYDMKESIVCHASSRTWPNTVHQPASLVKSLITT